MKHDNANIEEQSSNNVSKSILTSDELKENPSNDLVGYSHDSFVEIWFDICGMGKKLVFDN